MTARLYSLADERQRRRNALDPISWWWAEYCAWARAWVSMWGVP